MEANARPHTNDEVADDERDDLHPMNRVRPEPEDTGHGTSEGESQ